MRKDNPAVYECPKSRGGIHFWRRLTDGTGRAKCAHCRQMLSKRDADDCFRDG